MNALMDKIRQIRGVGLAEKGEFGPENLAFKLLRNTGDLKKLQAARQAAKDQELSLKERVRNSTKYGYGTDYIEEVGMTPDGTNPTTSQFTNETQLDEVGLTPDGTNPTTSQFTNETRGDDKSTIKNFMEFCADQIGIEKDISLRIRQDPQWSVRNKTFGRYNDGTNELEVGIGGRHIMDVLRTVAHELVHQKQNQHAQVPADAGEDGSKYENEANARAGVLMRKYGKLHPELFANSSSVSTDIAEGKEQITWIKPNFEFEWHEVEEQAKMKQVPPEVRQYYKKHFPTKNAWLKAVQHGKAVVVPADHTFEIRNAPHDKKSLLQVLAPTSHEGAVGPAKKKRVNALFAKGGPIEMPIVLKTSNGLWLIGGKTRLGTANYIKGIPAKVWMIDGAQGVSESEQRVIAHGYMYNRQDQRVAWTKEFGSEAEAKEWARRRNATLLSVVPKQELNEASGYIPTAEEADDPRFEMALSVDIHPGSLGKAANSFLLNTDSQGHPQELRPDGLVKRMTEELARFKIDGKLLETIDTELTEVKMSPGKLSSWAKKNGEGIRAGFEAELIFRDAHINTKSESKKGKFNIQIAKKLAKDLSKTIGVVTKVYSEPHEGERNDTDWIFEPDKSLKLDWLEDDDMPVEIITPPMPLSHTLEIMDKFFSWAKKNNARANELTGFHMSVSLPGMENKNTVDYVKLALFLGDEYILQQFAREANRYTASALSKLQHYAGDLGNMSALAMKAMKDFKQGLIKTAADILNSNNEYDKYTSINPHDNYIEFRSAGNQGYFSDIKKIQNTLTRYAYAMSIANDPNAGQKEYIKKLYMLLTSTATVQQTDPKTGKKNIIAEPDISSDSIALFSKFVAGEFSKEEFATLLRKLHNRTKRGQMATSTPTKSQEEYSNTTTQWEIRLRSNNKVIHKFGLIPGPNRESVAIHEADIWVEDNDINEPVVLSQVMK
jgi:hypothetical protein